MNQPLFLILAACLLAALASTATAAPRTPVFGEARVASWSPRPSGLLAKRENGDATYYDAGLGACGASNSDNDPIVALAAGLFGSRPGSSPFCGKCLAVTAGGRTLVLKVTDKCPGCSGGSLDMTKGFFQKFYPLDKGRGPISWVEASGCECLGDSPDCKGTAGKNAAASPALTGSNAAATAAAAAAAAAADLVQAKVGSPVTISAATTSTTSTTTTSTKPEADEQHPDAQYGKTQDAAKSAQDVKNTVIAAATSPAASNNNNGNHDMAPDYGNPSINVNTNQGGKAASVPAAVTQNNQGANVQATQVQNPQQSIESFSNGANEKWTQLLMQRAVDAARKLLRR